MTMKYWKNQIFFQVLPIIDNQLNWHAQVKHISNKISKSVSILRILRDIFPKHILKTLYLTLIYPFLNYCNLIWGSAYNSTLMPLTILQKKCIRLICNVDFFAHTDPLFKQTKLLKLNQMYILNCAKFGYSCYNSNSYSNFRIRMIQNSQFHRYDTRRKNDIRTPYERLQICQNSFLIKSIKLWNIIPNDIKQANSKSYFNSRMKKMLLTVDSFTNLLTFF